MKVNYKKLLKHLHCWYLHSLSLFLCRWWRQWQTSFASPPHITVLLPSTLWCFSAGKPIEGTDRRLTPSFPLWIGLSGTRPPSRQSQLGKAAENIWWTFGYIHGFTCSNLNSLLHLQKLLSAVTQPHPHRLNGSGDCQWLAESTEDGEISGGVWSSTSGHVRPSQHAHHGVSTYGHLYSKELFYLFFYF